LTFADGPGQCGGTLAWIFGRLVAVDARPGPANISVQVKNMPHEKFTREELLELLKQKSVCHGDFLLSSGGRSPFYIDCRRTTLDSAGARMVGQLMREMIEAEARQRGVRIDAVGGLTMGADPIALAAGMASHEASPESYFQSFCVRKAPKAHGQTKLIEGVFKPGDHVVVIDDVVTTGGSTIKAIEAVRAEGGIVEFVAVLVDRQEGGRARIEAMGLKVLALFVKSELIRPEFLGGGSQPVAAG
jgi:orotate phosphoribosyltransferase